MMYSLEEKKKILETKFPSWYYEFDLGDGVTTQITGKIDPAWHECRKNFIMPAIDAVFPEGLGGKTCLDVACNAGYWSFELARRGAERILAIDREQSVIDRALFARDCLNQNGELSAVEFRTQDIYDTRSEDGPFDLVIAFGVAYHLTDLLGFFQRLHTLCERVAVIDSSVITENAPTLELADAKKFYFCDKQEFSFVPSTETLVRIMSHVGFTSIMQLRPIPETCEPFHAGERVALLAFK